MSYYYLQVARGEHQGKRYLLEEGATSVGRSSESTIALSSRERSVSGHHLIIYRTSERILLQDLQSTNGTYVNEERVDERELRAGDVVGFGKSGPRLKLIESEEELSSAPDSGGGAKPPTTSTSRNAPAGAFTYETDHSRVARKEEPKKKRDMDALGRDDMFGEASSETIDMERKLVGKRMSSREMQRLLDNGGRLERIIDRGNLGTTQTHLLRMSYQAGRRQRKRWFAVLGGGVFLSTILIAYFSIRTYQYRKILNQGLTIEQELDRLEKRISQARKNPEENRETLKALLARLESRKDSLSSVKSRLNDADFGKFYSDPVERKIDEIIRRFGEDDYHIPPAMIDRVKYHLEIYSGRMHRTIAKYLLRKEKYFPMILRVLREKNLPRELAFISMLESGFNPRALSHAGARGLWQFMPATGRSYGLRVDGNVDERLDPEKATYAAAEYFKDLIGIFGSRSSVMLAMAAYNAGEGRVMGALRRIDDPMRDRDFWYIYRMGYLAEETNEYIPRVIALMIISEYPDEYGFGGLHAPREELETEDDFIDLDKEEGLGRRLGS